MFGWISKLFSRKAHKAANDQISIKGHTYEVFSQAAHTLYYQLLCGAHPGEILLEVRSQLSKYEFPVAKPTDIDQCLFTTYRMLENLEKNGWFDRFLTFEQYNLLHMLHRERVRYSNDLYNAFLYVSVFNTATMDLEMANEMENAKKKKNKGFEKRLRIDAAIQASNAQRLFNIRTATLERIEEQELLDTPPPVHRNSIHNRPVTPPSPATLHSRHENRFSIISRISARSPGPPPPHRLPTPPRNHPDVQHLEEYTSAVNTGRNSRGRPNPVNLNLLPPGSPGSLNL